MHESGLDSKGKNGGKIARKRTIRGERERDRQTDRQTESYCRLGSGQHGCRFKRCLVCAGERPGGQCLGLLVKTGTPDGGRNSLAGWAAAGLEH